eukprot:2206931-Rhodomonas_salina.3
MCAEFSESGARQVSRRTSISSFIYKQRNRIASPAAEVGSTIANGLIHDGERVAAIHVLSPHAVLLLHHPAHFRVAQPGGQLNLGLAHRHLCRMDRVVHAALDLLLLHVRGGVCGVCGRLVVRHLEGELRRHLDHLLRNVASEQRR